MEPYAVLSDVNANLEALQAVMADVDGLGIKTILFLGDAIGGGPDPLACVSLLRLRAKVYLRGSLENHLLDSRVVELGSPFLEETLLAASQDLNAAPGDAEWLRARPITTAFDHVVAVHADPRGPEYPPLFFETINHSQRTRDRVFPLFSSVLLVGGNHSPWIVSEDGSLAVESKAEQRIKFPTLSKTIVSVGSVGQPLDGDSRACYAVIEGRSIVWRRVAYDVEATVAKIEKRYELGSKYAQSLKRGYY